MEKVKKNDEPIIQVLGYQVEYYLLNEKFKKNGEGLYYTLMAMNIFEEFKEKGMGVKRINKSLKKGTKVTYVSLYEKPRKKLEILRSTLELVKDYFEKSVELGEIEGNPLGKADIDKAVLEWEKQVVPRIEKVMEKVKKEKKES